MKSMRDTTSSNHICPTVRDLSGERALDPFRDSVDRLVGMTFLKTSSSAFPLAASLARGAALYSIVSVGAQELHLSIFEKTTEQASRAVALLNTVITWKASQYFCGGRLIQSRYQVKDILRCYLAASSLPDPHAHCWVVPDDPGLALEMKIHGPRPPAPVFPCRHLAEHFRHQPSHPSPLPELIHAAAVDRGCDWCPLFPAPPGSLPATLP